MGKALPRLPHICKRNTATFIRQISATLQVTPKRTLGLEEHQRPSRPISPSKGEHDEAESRGEARPQKQELQPLGRQGSLNLSIPTPIFFCMTFSWPLEDTVLPVCIQVSVSQSSAFLFPLWQFLKNTYILWETLQRHHLDKVFVVVAKSCLTLVWHYGLQPARLLCPWDFPGSPTEWVAISFSRGSSRPRDWIQVSYIGRQILYQWVTRKVPDKV